jgi:hypothetical protein
MALHKNSDVMSAHDLQRGRDIIIRQGTPGRVTDPRGWMGTYTVEFRPADAADTRITIRGLTQSDLRSVMIPKGVGRHQVD